MDAAFTVSTDRPFSFALYQTTSMKAANAYC